MQRISSVQNQRIRALRDLRERRGRMAAGQYLIEGGKMVEEALIHAAPVCAVVDEDRLETYAAVLEGLERAGAEVLAVPGRILAAVCETKTPQGIAAAVRMPRAPTLQTLGVAGLGKRLVALDSVQDPGNVGAILRAADAAGIQGMLLGPNCADAYGGKALRASMGSIFRVPVLPAAELSETLMALKSEGYAVLSSQLDGEDFFERGMLPDRLVLVIGNEGEGVSAAVSAVATHRLRLPMYGGAESLNAAVAAGIMLYDLARAWGKEVYNAGNN